MKSKVVKKFLPGLFLLVTIFIKANAQQVALPEATLIAGEISTRIFSSENGPQASTNFTIKQSEPIYYEGKIIGYVFYFSPGGYVIIPSHREMRLFFTASGNENKRAASNTLNTFVKPMFVKHYLDYANQVVTPESIKRNREMWDKFLAKK